MTKRNCYVTDVGDAIERLANALDPERTKPFSGDILDLLEWATKDVLAMRAEIERLKTVPMKYRRMAFNAQLQDENSQLSQQLDAANTLINKYREETTTLRQQVTLLRFKLFYANDLLMNTYHHVVPSIQEALDATKEN